MAWEKLGSASGGGTTPATSWKELGRATLSSDGDSLDVGSITAKDNLMIISYVKETSGSLHASLRFNNDSGSNYAHRSSTNGGSDWTSTSQDKLRHGAGTSNTRQFNVSTIINKSDQEKLVHTSMAYTQDGTLYREETVGKWANSSAQINDVELLNTQSGSFDSGSEIIVMGFDNDEADEGTNFWQELSSTTLTANNSGTLTIPQFTPKKYMWIEYYINGSTDSQWRVGTGGSIDSGSNQYDNRYASNGSSDSTLQYTSFLQHNGVVGGNVFMINKSDEKKLMIQHEGGADSTPANRREDVGQWNNTSGQIDILAYTKSNVTYYPTTQIKVYGAD